MNNAIKRCKMCNKHGAWNPTQGTKLCFGVLYFCSDGCRQTYVVEKALKSVPNGRDWYM